MKEICLEKKRKFVFVFVYGFSNEKKEHYCSLFLFYRFFYIFGEHKKVGVYCKLGLDIHKKNVILFVVFSHSHDLVCSIYCMCFGRTYVPYRQRIIRHHHRH